MGVLVGGFGQDCFSYFNFCKLAQPCGVAKWKVSASEKLFPLLRDLVNLLYFHSAPPANPRLNAVLLLSHAQARQQAESGMAGSQDLFSPMTTTSSSK